MAREQLQGLLAAGADRDTNIVCDGRDTRLVVQELLEGEQRAAVALGGSPTPSKVNTGSPDGGWLCACRLAGLGGGPQVS
jgi:hypothetical protein